MVPQVEQLLLGVQVDILMFSADGATDPRVNRQHFEFPDSPRDRNTYTLLGAGPC